MRIFRNCLRAATSIFLLICSVAGAVSSQNTGIPPITITSISDQAIVPSNWYHPIIEWDDCDTTASSYQLNVRSEKQFLTVNVTGAGYRFTDSSFMPFLKNREVRFHVTRKAGKALISSDTVRVFIDTLRFLDDIVYRLVEPLFNDMQDAMLETVSIEIGFPQPWGKARRTCVGCHAYAEGCAVFNARRGSRRQLLIATATKHGDQFQNSLIGEFSFLNVNKAGNRIAVVTGANSMIDKKKTFDEPFDMTYHAGDISVFDVHSGTFAPLPGASSSEFVEDMPAWSDNGASLLFCRYTPNVKENRLLPVIIMRIPYNDGKGGEARPLLENPPSNYCYFPKWSPDGNFISFVSGDARRGYFARNSSEIWMYALKGKHLCKMKLNAPGTMNSWHAWSSDCRWMVFSSKRGKDRITAAYCARIDADGADHPAFRVSPNADMKINLPYLIPGGSFTNAGKNFGEILETIFKH